MLRDTTTQYGHEFRPASQEMEIVVYEPVREWITGMGVVTGWGESS